MRRVQALWQRWQRLTSRPSSSAPRILLSILPILSIPGITPGAGRRNAPLVAVSPIIGGEAVKGPAAKIMNELGYSVSSVGVAGFYGRLLDGLMIDTSRRPLGARNRRI